MKAKEFVLSKYPRAKCSKHTSGVKGFNQKTWFLISNTSFGNTEGTSESNAWKNAKDYIVKMEKDETT